MKLYEMEGFLLGKCIPGDLKVNETNAEYLVRKFSEAEERCAELSARLSMINGIIEAAEQGNKLAQEATETLVQERNALAAENVGLKAAIDSTIGWQQSTDPVNVESVRMLVDIETTATDAFLAEVRAHGVEMFSEKFGGGTLISDMVKEIAKDFAAQLRKGVQS